MSHSTRRLLALAALCLSVAFLAPMYALLRTLGLDAPSVPNSLGTLALAAACMTAGFAALTSQADAARTREGTA